MNQAKYRLIYTILLFLGTLFLIETNPLDSSIALPQTSVIPAASLQQEQTTETLTTNDTTLPPEIQSAVFQDTAKRTSKTIAALRILEFQPQNWSDGCLGLAKPDELCTQVITPGWRIIVTDGLRNWTYRTDDLGNLVKLEKSPQ